MDVLEIEEISSTVFQQILDFVYTGKTEMNDDVIYPLLNAANIMKIKSLIQKCFEYIK